MACNQILTLAFLSPVQLQASSGTSQGLRLLTWRKEIMVQTPHGLCVRLNEKACKYLPP